MTVSEILFYVMLILLATGALWIGYLIAVVLGMVP